MNPPAPGLLSLSVNTRAKLLVAEGAPLHARGGEVLTPAQVCTAGIAAPSAYAVLVSVKGPPSTPVDASPRDADASLFVEASLLAPPEPATLAPAPPDDDPLAPPALESPAAFWLPPAPPEPLLPLVPPPEAPELPAALPEPLESSDEQAQNPSANESARPPSPKR